MAPSSSEPTTHDSPNEPRARLVRIALAEARRRAAGTPVRGQELDDVAHQAADLYGTMVAPIAIAASSAGCSASLTDWRRPALSP